MEPKTDDKPCRKSEDYDSMQKNEHWIGVNQVKMQNKLVVEVKSEKPDTEPTVDNLKIENMDTMILNEQLNIKSEYNEDPVCHLIWDRVKEEEKIESGIERDSTADSVEQRKLGFQESEKMEEKPDLSSTYFENMDAVGLHEEFDIKTESDQSDDHNSPTDSAQIKKKREKELGNPPIEEGKKSFSCLTCNYTSVRKKDLTVHKKRNSCHLESNLEKSRSVSKKQYRLDICIKCNEVFKSKTLLDDHLARKHTGYIPFKIHECKVCDFVFVHERDFTRHMLRHNDVPDRHICKHCNASFKKNRPLFDHILKTHPEYSGTVSSKIYECIHCAFKITSRTNFIKHMAKHNAQKPFECMNCDASFKTKPSLDHHILQKHPECTASVSSKIHECVHCEYKTTHVRSLDSHMMKHTGVKITCANCDALFTSKRTLDNHISQKHPELSASLSCKIHECTHCEYKTTRSGDFATHIMKHTGAKLTCTKCDASFISKQSFENHILQKHPESTASVSSKIHECKHCEYKTIVARNLASHMMKHTGAKLSCTKCDASFISKYSLDNHILQKHPDFTASVSYKIHECTHCKYKTTHARDLARHIIKHTGAKLTCTRCDASFITKCPLDNHILQKHPELTACVSHKIHECTDCEYKTTYAKSLAIHMMKHTGAKLTCTKCDASFASKQSLDDHTLQKHPEFIASVSCNIYECTHCEYKTTRKYKLTKHTWKHTQS